MKKYLAIYTGTDVGPQSKTWNALDPKTQKETGEKGMAAWIQWGEKNKNAIVVEGGPLGKTKRTDAKGIQDTKNNMSGYIVIQAASHEEAAKMFLEHPHFSIFPGDAVEIMECLDIPKM